MQHLEQVIANAISQTAFTGASVAIRHSSLPDPYFGAWGTTPPNPVTSATVFDLASVTKIFTATLYARLVDRGWLSFETPVSQYLQGADSRILARHLLSHSAGLIAYGEFFKELPKNLSLQDRRAWMRKRMMALVPEVEPGSRELYSDPSFLILGFLIEEATGRALDDALQDFVLKPLGILGLSFGSAKEPVAKTEDCPWRQRVLCGEVHDENAWTIGGVAGHAGLFGRAQDVMQLVNGLFGGFLAPSTLAQMWGPLPGSTRTLGWDTASASGSSIGSTREKLFGGAAVGHLGYTGTSVWVGPLNKTAVVLLTNRVHPSRANDAIRRWRPRIHEAIAKDLNT